MSAPIMDSSCSRTIRPDIGSSACHPLTAPLQDLFPGTSNALRRDGEPQPDRPGVGSRNAVPKCRRKALYVELRKHLGEVFRHLAQQKESRIEEGHLMADHVHMLIAIPRKYAVSQVVGFIKGKSAIHLARVYGERKRNFVGQHFWARGYFVSTVGRDEEVIRDYIRKQEEEDMRLEQINLWR